MRSKLKSTKAAFLLFSAGWRGRTANQRASYLPEAHFSSASSFQMSIEGDDESNHDGRHVKP